MSLMTLLSRTMEPLGQRALKGSSSLESFIATEFILFMISKYGVV